MNECVFGHIEDTTELNQVYHTNRLYHSDEFEVLLERSGADLNDISELENILEFISVQCGDWFSRWVCSPANEPDIDAQAEFDNWELLWRAFTQSQFKSFPDRLEVITDAHIKQRDMRLLAHANRSNNRGFLRRFSKICSYWASRFFSSIGLNWIANMIFSRSMYPKGSVGRT